MTVNTDEDILWSSSNPQIASVDETGNVSGHKQGTVDILAIKANDNNNYATYQVIVIGEHAGEMKYYETKILTIDQEKQEIEFLNIPYTKYTKDTKFYLYTFSEEIVPITIDDLYIGLDNIYVAANPHTETIEVVLVNFKVAISNIRVAIRKDISDIANDATLYHDNISLNTIRHTTLQTFDGKYKISLQNYNNIFNFKVENGYINVLVNNQSVLKTKKRIIISSEYSIRVTSIYRSNGNPSYDGSLEISLVGNRLLLINDTTIENYLTKVVPSEMPSYFGFEALKAQAVAARTFAYQEILKKANDKDGYAVDDSVKSQVYNNVNPNNNITWAIQETNGLIMTADGKPINIYYYSSSSGLTASAHEVWIENEVIEPIPGLIGQNFCYDHETGEKITFDYRDEESMLAFFKRIRMETPDLDSPYHRWKIAMTPQQLSTTISKNLKISYQNAPNSIQTYRDGNWVSQDIPENIGNVTNIYVDQRGESGVVISLIIETTSGTYKIINQYNIRFTIRPKDAGSDVDRETAKNTDDDYSEIKKNDSILPSGFFAITREGNDFVFYGGGNGHGVGMSQYGARGLASQGYSYHKILETYFYQVNLTNINVLIKPIKKYQDLLEKIIENSL